MIRYSLLFSVCIVFILVTRCSNDPASPSTVIASETWLLNDVGTQNYCDLSFSKHDDGSVSVNGKWYYHFFGFRITCSFMSGSADFSESMVEITASGTASYPPDPSGIADTSAFTLHMNGTFQAGTSKGGWQIHFADSLWEGWVRPGVFTGVIKTGNGITAL